MIDDPAKTAVAAYFAGKGRNREQVVERFRELGWTVPKNGEANIADTMAEPERVIARREALMRSRARDAEIRAEKRRQAEEKAKNAPPPISGHEKKRRHRDAVLQSIRQNWLSEAEVHQRKLDRARARADRV